MSGILAEIEQRFWEKGISFNRAEIIELIAEAGMGTAASGAIFTIEADDDSYEEVGVNAVISDIRLIGKTGYPVYTTQNNVEFRKAELTYDSLNGKLTIPDFNLQSGEHITIFAIGAATPDDFSSVLSRLTLLEKLTAPMLGGKIVMVWEETDPVALPPAGWVEVTDYSGLFMMGRDGAQPLTGGSDNVVLTNANMPSGVRVGGEGSTYDEALGTGDTRKHTDAGSATPVNFKPKYKQVRYIRWIG